MKRKHVLSVLLALAVMSSCQNGSDKSPEQMKELAFKADSLEIVNEAREVFAKTCILISRGDGIIEENLNEVMNKATDSMSDAEIKRLADKWNEKNKADIQREADKLGIGDVYSEAVRGFVSCESLPFDMDIYENVPEQSIERLTKLYSNSYDVLKKYAFYLYYDNFRHPQGDKIKDKVEEVRQMIKNHK